MAGTARVSTITAATVALTIAGALWAARDPGDFRFAILGDRTGDTQPGVYEQVWREVDQWHPDMVINAGDTIQGGSDATARSEWKALHPLFEKYQRYPIYFTPGNHDIWSEESAKVYEEETGHPRRYSFDFRDAHFIVLDNSGGDTLEPSEIGFLTADLAKNQGKRLKFVFFHRPVWLMPVMFGAKFPLHEIATKYGISAVVSGHSHRFARFVQDGVTYLMVGSSGGHLRASGFEDGWFFHHVRVTVAGGKFTFVVKEAGQPYGEGRTFRDQDWGSGPVMAKHPSGAAATR